MVLSSCSLLSKLIEVVLKCVLSGAKWYFEGSRWFLGFCGCLRLFLVVVQGSRWFCGCSRINLVHIQSSTRFTWWFFDGPWDMC